MSPIPFELRRSRRARRVTITVRLDGSVRLSVPLRYPAALADTFVESKGDWIARTRQKIAARPAWEKQVLAREDRRAAKQETWKIVSERIEFYSSVYRTLGLELPSLRKITVRDQRSRWGSCSRRGTLSFNLRLYFLPPDLQDYIVVHELCHLREFHHRPAFWALVAKAIPDYNERKKKLNGKQ